MKDEAARQGRPDTNAINGPKGTECSGGCLSAAELAERIGRGEAFTTATLEAFVAGGFAVHNEDGTYSPTDAARRVWLGVSRL